jgi:hypothetical protein
MSFTIFLIIAAFIAWMFYKTWEKSKSQQSEHSTHFGMLDENGDPIKSAPSGSPAGNIPKNEDNSDAPILNLKYFCVKDKGYHVTVWPKDQPVGGYIEFNIAGMSHRDNIDHYLGEFVATLEPEPSNPYDHNAIKILAPDGHHVGYVPRDFTDAIRDIAHLPCHCYAYIGCNDGTYFSDCYIEVK